MNKELSEIISINNRASVLSAISSNLNIRKDFVDVIKAKPTWLRVSTSGWGKNYELTHTGGQWDLFYKNLYLLKEHKERYHPELIVEVFYHIYAHNRDDYKKYEILCDELGFTLRHRHAALAPLDNIAACIEGREMSPEVIKTRELQVLKVSEAMTLAREQINRPCYYERHLWIDWNLQIAQCMEWYAPELNLVDEDFLSVSANDLLKAREESEFCVKCKERAIHRCYCVYGDEKLIQKD